MKSFHPLVSGWFGERVGSPTEIQALAWPRIAAGEHVLVTAPTGSGKTLTAFLWALERLLTGAWEGGRVRVLYVSPLRALNNDIRRNLLAPLAELEETFRRAGQEPHAVRVLTRSGDTPQEDRRRMARNPPEILITTPESLNILLTSKGGRALLPDLACVILDEIHAVASSKRGTHLATAVERLTLLAGEIQRIALSATIRPLERIAAFVGGFVEEEGIEGAEPRYRPRPVAVLRSGEPKRYDLRVCVASQEDMAAGEVTGGFTDRAPSIWQPLVAQLRERIGANRSTLLFANSRRITEKVTRLLNSEADLELAYSHHGSLSREIRAVVEQRLKEGSLAAIVATSSLELGIDIGSLDEVLLLRTPPTVASAVQRVGRAGHQVGEVSRARLYPLFDRDVLDAAVVARGVLTQDIEEARPVAAPLDVLAQVILSMVVAETWRLDDLYRFLHRTWPYRDLSRRQFELVVEMLAGRYAAARLRELHPRVSVDRVDGTIRARPGAARLIYLSGGTIPDRGYYHLRLKESGAKLGELDEEFVWERSVGDTFSLGAQSWRIQAITHNDVVVTPARRSAAMAPFWRAEERDRSWHLSERLGVFLETAQATLSSRAGRQRLAEALSAEHAMEERACERLLDLLERQRAATGVALPHRRHLLVERVIGGAGERGSRTILHNFWGGRINRPLALILEAIAEEELGIAVDVEHDNDCLLLDLPDGVEVTRLLELARPERVEDLLRRRLERTGFFGARFRENAGRALLLPRRSFRRRVPLWLTRQRSKRLLEEVFQAEDFPVLVETWRTCLHDEFELEPLKRLLAEVDRGDIQVSEATTDSPSPFAANLLWKQTNRLVYEDDTPEATGVSGLSRDLLRELVFASHLRPRLPASLIDRFQRKLQRLWPGYAPRGALDLLDWLKERIAIPRHEWGELLAAMERDRSAEEPGVEVVLRELEPKVLRVELPAASVARTAELVCAVEGLPRLLRALGLQRDTVRLRSAAGEGAPPEALEALDRLIAEQARAEADEGAEDAGADALADVVTEWIRFYGPFRRELLGETFGLVEESLQDVLETLLADERVVIDLFREGDEGDQGLEICDAENLERLLRLLRSELRPAVEPLPLAELPRFLAGQQGLVSPRGDPEALKAILDKLIGYVAPANLWETDLLPARLDPYYTTWLDALFQESDLLWLGSGREKLAFVFPSDVELLRDPIEEGEAKEQGDAGGPELDALFPDRRARYRVQDLAFHSGRPVAEVVRGLWDLAWRGAVSNSGFAAVRRGALGRFEPTDRSDSGQVRARAREQRVSRRTRFDRWRPQRPEPGTWFRLDEDNGLEAQELDPLELEEMNKDRARLLLARYGVVFRELLGREAPPLRWPRLFRTLRLMELSGEVVAGHFFDGVPGLQFASPTALRELRQSGSEDAIWWISAADPASPCGLGLEGLRGEYPSRLPSTHLVFHGSRPVVISKRHGADLEIRVGPDHPHLEDYFGFLRVLLTRQHDPRKVIAVETINGERAPASPWAGPLAALFSTSSDFRSLKLRRRY